jgi:hypothetical protein
MEGAREFLEQVRQHQLVAGHFLGLLHLMIGRRITRADGTVLSSGLTWRQLAELLKLLRWDKDCVRELGLDPDELPPRDRNRYWYTAITSAKVDSPEASAAADLLARKMALHGYRMTSANRS